MKDRVAVVTGAANGLGREIAILLTARARAWAFAGEGEPMSHDGALRCAAAAGDSS